MNEIVISSLPPQMEGLTVGAIRERKRSNISAMMEHVRRAHTSGGFSSASQIADCHTCQEFLGEKHDLGLVIEATSKDPAEAILRRPQKQG